MKSIKTIIHRRVIVALLAVESLLFFVSLARKSMELGDAENAGDELFLYALGLLGMVLVLLLITTYAVGMTLERDVTGPIRRIAEANRAIAEGNEESCCELSESAAATEIREIIRSRNLMLSRLAEMRKAMQSELDMAAEMQRTLLPAKLPSSSSVEISLHYKPLNYAGGDFYDFHEREGELGVLVGDVSGHGVDSAMAAMLVKTPFRHHVGNGHSPGELLGELNDSLFPVIGNSGIFMTIQYGLFDFERRVVLFASAGHPAPVRVSRDGRVDYLALENGPLAGPFDDAEYTTTEVPFVHGDRFYFYTDGILETPNDEGEQFGKERFLWMTAETQTFSVPESVRRITTVAEGFSQGNSIDDVLLLAVEITG